MKFAQSFVIVIFAYVLAHGLTSLLITPWQMRLLPEITGFASLVYLPHGVRVLSTWLLGRAAFIPLCLGAFTAEILFTPAEVSRATDLTLLLSISVGAGSALLAFTILKPVERSLYAGRKFRIYWKWLLLVGVVASIINSIGQTIVFSGEFLSGHFAAILVTYAMGDLIGLILTTLGLMVIFRWIRHWSNRSRPI